MNLFISNFRNIAKERIILFLLLFSVFIVVCRIFIPDSDEYRVIENNSFWKKKTFDRKKYEVVICGDSRVYRGISPNEMKSVFENLSILNFGYGSAGYNDVMFHEINKKVNWDAEIKIIILGITPVSLTKNGALNHHLNYELQTKREEIIELLYFKKLMQFFVPTTFEQIFWRIKGKKYKVTKHQEYIDDGWVATFEEYPDTSSALKSYSTYFINNQVVNENVDNLVHEVKKWTSKNAFVFAFRPPTTYSMAELEDSVSGFKEEEIRRKLEFAGARWLIFNLKDYFCFDGSHLQKESAIRFSNDLAIKIRNELQANKYIK